VRRFDNRSFKNSFIFYLKIKKERNGRGEKER